MRIEQVAETILRVNTEDAQKKLDGLQAKARDLREKFAEAFRNGDARGVVEINKKLQKVDGEIRRIRLNSANVIDVLNRMDKATPRELQRAIRGINDELNSGRVERGSRLWEEYTAKLRLAKLELKQVQAQMEGTPSESLLERMRDGINEWGASAAAAAAAFGGIVLTGKAAVEAYAEMEAEEANVMKYTGMSRREVEMLNGEFKKMDTRTPRLELNKLAQEAGRLGKDSVEDVLGFVKAADQINVALDELGDGATLEMSKLTGIFGEEKIHGTEKSLLKVGSVINDLSQNCSASAPYLAEFSSRMGGIAAQSDLTIPQVMAFAAVLDTQNQNVEAASTALGQLITSIYKEPQKIAKAAMLDVGEFSELVKTDMNGALMMLFEQFSKLGGMGSLAKVLDDMGTDGERATAVLSALAGHVGELRSQQEAANLAFEEGTSVTKEFSVQNTTVQARLDKAREKFNDLARTLGEKLLPVMSSCISGTSALMRVMNVMADFIGEYGREILIAAGALAAYNIAVAVHNSRAAMAARLTGLWHAAMSKMQGVTAVARVAIAAATNAVQYLTNGLKVNMAMQQRWSKAMAGMKLSSWIGLILAAGTALAVYLSRQHKTITAEDTLASVRRKAAEQAADETERIRDLDKAARNEALSLDERRRAMEELNRIVPDYNASLDETTGKYTASTEALDKYCDALFRSYEIEAAKEELKSLSKNRRDAQKKYDSLSEQEENLRKAEQRGGTAAMGGAATGMNITSVAASNVDGQLKAAKKELDSLNSRIDALKEELGVSLLAATSPTNGGTTATATEGTLTLGETEAERKAREKAQREARQKEKEALKEALDQQKYLRDKAEAENLLRYSTGERDFLEYTREKERIEKEYADAVVRVHEESGAIDIAAYGSALKKRVELAREHAGEQRQITLKEVEERHRLHEDNAVTAFYDPKGPLFKNQQALDMALMEEDMRYLREKRDLHEEGSRERADIERQIEDRLAQDKLRKQKMLAKAMEDFSKANSRAQERMQMAQELNMLSKLLSAGLISEEEFLKAASKIRARYRRAEMSQEFNSIDEVFRKITDLMGTNGALIQKKVTEWMVGLSAESQEKLSEAFSKGFGSSLGQSLSASLQAAAAAVEIFSLSAEDRWERLLESLSDMCASAAAAIGGVLQTFGSYWDAARDLELAKVEKRYDREIAAAGKNEKKKKKLEEQREKEVAAIKNKYNSRSMKLEVAQAIAQTAANALGAYGAMVKIPVVGPALAAAAAAAATAAGMIQVATIRKQHQAQAQGYYAGGFTPRHPDNLRETGVVHANEFVANHRAVANPAIAPLLRLIDHAQRNNTVGSISAEDIRRAIPAGGYQGVGPGGGLPAAASAVPEAVAVAAAMAGESNALTREAIDRLSDRLEEGIEAYVVLDGEDGLYHRLRRFKKIMENPKR